MALIPCSGKTVIVRCLRLLFGMKADRTESSLVQVLQLGCHHLRRMWRARKRSVANSHSSGHSADPAEMAEVLADVSPLSPTTLTLVPRAQSRARRPRRAHHEAYRPRRQHFQHACRCPRSLHLHWYHSIRVLPRPRNGRLHDGRLDLSMGRGIARNLGSIGRNAC